MKTEFFQEITAEEIIINSLYIFLENVYVHMTSLTLMIYCTFICLITYTSTYPC